MIKIEQISWLALESRQYGDVFSNSSILPPWFCSGNFVAAVKVAHLLLFWYAGRRKEQQLILRPGNDIAVPLSFQANQRRKTNRSFYTVIHRIFLREQNSNDNF